MVDWISFGVVWLVRSINRIDGSRVFLLQEVVGAGERREKVRGFHLQNDHKICDCALGYLKNSCNDLRGNDPPTTKNNARDCIIFVGVYVAHVEFVP